MQADPPSRAQYDLGRLDQYLPADMRAAIEQRYYARVNEQGRLEALIRNREFLDQPERHVAFFSDHGVVHVRDVAVQILHVLDTVHGVLVPEREPPRLQFMKAYGVLVAYLHDIGMVDFTNFGRDMHCEYATRAVMSAELDDFVSRVWTDNIGGLAERLSSLAARGHLRQTPPVVLREMLAMANCHSKRSVPVEALGNRERLADMMRWVAFVPLERQYEAKRTGRPPSLRGGQHAADATAELTLSHLPAHVPAAYQSPADSYRWLLEPNRRAQQLAEDVIDSLRALRCADALRQRGTVQKTSGGYEVFVNNRTADAVYAMRYGEERLFLVDIPNPIAAGEANIASSELEHDGTLRIAFHLGAFPTEKAMAMAVDSAARVIRDIHADVVASFARKGVADPTSIVLESVGDNPTFVERVAARLREDLTAGETVAIAAPLQDAAQHERDRYLRASTLDWDMDLRCAVLHKIGRTGHKTVNIDPVEGLREVRLTRLAAGEQLMRSGDPSGFVYVPLGPGCVGQPLGGYQPFVAPAWTPLGVTGVIRNASRNATIVAEQEVELLMIPKAIYLRWWHHTYSLEEFMTLLRREYADQGAETHEQQSPPD